MSEPAERPDYRASDADRERVARRLHDAMAEGRLDVGELDERLAGLYRTRTVGELEVFTRDLPAPAGWEARTAGEVAVPDRVGGTPASRSGVAVLSELKRDGEWVVPERYTVTAFWGAVRLDLREATFERRECTIHAVSVMGSVEILVPPELTVYVAGVGIMGVFEQGAARVGDPNGPALRITGVALMGAVEIKRLERPARRPRLGG